MFWGGGGGIDEIWGRGQKIYENHIQFGLRGVEGGGRELFLPPPPSTRHRTICKDKIKVWERLTKRHILQSSNTTDSHILGWADGTQTRKCLQKCPNVCIMFAKN